MNLYFYQKPEPVYDPTADMRLIQHHFGDKCAIYPDYKCWTANELAARERLLRARALRLGAYGALVVGGVWVK